MKLQLNDYRIALWLMLLLLCPFHRCMAQARQPYTVAAYVWPSLHHEERSGKVLWPDGEGEWEVIRKGTPRFEGHYQPKLPLWGYERDDDPRVYERWINAATTHGVNTFIFDWYWFDGQPFLENALDSGFLQAKNNRNMQFYVMWANHDVKRNYWNVHRYGNDTTRLWAGAVDEKDFHALVQRVIRQYFKQPNYYKIAGQPVFSIFSLSNFLKGLNGLAGGKKALDYFREATRKAGFPGLHVQLIANGQPDTASLRNIRELGINSVTQYNWGGPHAEDYLAWAAQSTVRSARWSDSLHNIPFFPNASIGWDDTPRFPQKGRQDVVHYNNTPQTFAYYLQKAKEYADAHPAQPKLITVFSWNEWIEGGYLLPDAKDGFGYLQAVRQVMNGSYGKY
jgi:hypothetical protein